MVLRNPRESAVQDTTFSNVGVSYIVERNLSPAVDTEALYVLLKIKTAEDAAERPPLHVTSAHTIPPAINFQLQVSVVMDKSGSMSGSKLTCAKRATRKLIKHLGSTHQS